MFSVFLVPGPYQAKNSATHLIFLLQYHETLPNNILFCPTQNIYILHEYKEGPYLVPGPYQAKK